MNQTENMTCRSCGEAKPIELFENDKRYEGGKSSRCKKCKAGDARSRFYNINRKAKQDGIPLDLTFTQFNSLYSLASKCFYCGITSEESGTTHHIDHIIPKSRGGTHNESNVVVSCDKCNRIKGNRAILDFFNKREEFTFGHLYAITYYVAVYSNRTMDDVFEEWIRQQKDYATCEA